MKKNLLLIFCVLLGLVGFAQQKNDIVLEWKEPSPVQVGDTTVVLPQFQGKYMQYDTSRRQLSFSYTFATAGAVNPESLQLDNIIYESVTAGQLGQLSTNNLPTTVNATIGASLARSDWYAVLRLAPIIKDASGYKRLKSFSFSYVTGAGQAAARSVMSVNAVSNSVLANGDWFRFYVEKSGVYKVSRQFLESLGFNANTDPRKIKIYGNGGRMLPLLNSTPYPMDLEENAVMFIGEEDGVFDGGDYILFYAEGVDNWNSESDTHSNLFADRSYYYVTSGGADGKRIGAMAQPAAPPTVTTGSYDEYQYHEKDLINIARLGRKWHGEAFNVDESQEFKFSIPDLDPDPVTVIVSAAAVSTFGSSMAVKLNSQAAGTLNFGATDQYVLAADGLFTGTFQPGGNDITVGLDFNNGGVPTANAWLDYIIIKAKRKLRGYGKQFRFTYNAAAASIGTIEYQMSNTAGISHVWDITDIYNVSALPNQANQQSFTFRAAMGEARKYIAVVPSDYYSPAKEGNPRVVNQNLKGTIFNNAQGQFQDVDYIIVTPQFLKGQADVLANFHRVQSALNVKVVTLDNIYQEFSSGKQDIGAIRNFVKYVYTNASTPDKRIKYLNLFGDASFDYKDRIPRNTNVVPILHAYDAPGGGSQLPNYDLTMTFASDDFFGLMDAHEGRMLGDDNDGLDVAVGRMLVSSPAQAAEMVNKVVEYKAAESYGRWRNEYIVVSDDLDNGGELLMQRLDQLAQTLVAAKPFINMRKVHTDSYVQEASAGGQRYPQAKEQLIRYINYGALVVNYLGHGGEDGMAGERIFEKADAQNLTNKDKYPLFITCTCELTKFDNPYRPTCGEYIYWNPKGGAIAMITTTRAIFVNVALSFNDELSTRLYSFAGGDYPTMAEALRQSKLTQSNYARVIAFVGDPALKLAIPKPKVVLTAVNDIPVSAGPQVLNSLSYVKMAGMVTDEGGNIINNYNGDLAVSVFDKNIQRHTLGNDDPSIIKPFVTLGETIFRGNASVNNGRFEFGFVVPRDIRIPVGNGRISFYAKRNNVLEDQNGYDNGILVGGVNANAVADNTPPKVKLYMNDTSFVNGGITNSSPIFLAFLEDEHGINTASGIGHDIIAILDGDENNPYILNDYYETELNDFTRGHLSFPLSNLAKGLHTITFKAWDVYNNPITAEIQFVVVGDEGVVLEKVLNYPNPFVSYTEFWFTHNRPYEPLDVQVQIFTVTGKVVKTINQSVTTDGFLSREIRWDGRDDFGDRIGKGVYIYKLTVKSSTTNNKAEKYEKLVLL